MRRLDFTSGLRSTGPSFRGAIFAVAVLLLLVLIGAGVRGRRAEAALVRADPSDVLGRAPLRRVALSLGRGVYVAHCAACHGANGTGSAAAGVPDLTDGEHLYGRGTVAEIEEIVRHGIRAQDPRGWDLAAMPAFAAASPYARYRIASLSPREIDDVSAYVRTLSGHAVDAATAARGATVFNGRGECFDCHSFDAKGDPYTGTPDLTDRVWLYGDASLASIRRTIAQGRAGASPPFEGSLSALETRAVAAYVASLGHLGPPMARSAKE